MYHALETQIPYSHGMDTPVHGDDSTEKNGHEISLDSETVPIILKRWSHINNINVTKELVRYTNSQVHTRPTESETLGDWAQGFVF